MSFKVLQDKAGCAFSIFSLISQHQKHHLGRFPEQWFQPKACGGKVPCFWQDCCISRCVSALRRFWGSSAQFQCIFQDWLRSWIWVTTADLHQLLLKPRSLQGRNHHQCACIIVWKSICSGKTEGMSLLITYSNSTWLLEISDKNSARNIGKPISLQNQNASQH